MWTISLFTLGLFVLVVDYGRMLYLRWRMVTARFFATFMPWNALLTR
jgi:hypothetical protein